MFKFLLLSHGWALHVQTMLSVFGKKVIQVLLIITEYFMTHCYVNLLEQYFSVFLLMRSL